MDKYLGQDEFLLVLEVLLILTFGRSLVILGIQQTQEYIDPLNEYLLHVYLDVLNL